MDVNVHPAKTEVRFQQVLDVSRVLLRGLRKALQEHGIRRQVTERAVITTQATDSAVPLPLVWKREFEAIQSLYYTSPYLSISIAAASSITAVPSSLNRPCNNVDSYGIPNEYSPSKCKCER